MTNSNSFNICSRCGTANSLNAKYCYSCGSQLKIPEEPVVCHNCHSVNTSMANFCRTCGATLKVGQQTKICPRCRKEVRIDQNQCNCGYSFATVSAVNPIKDPIDPRTGVSYHARTAAAENAVADDKPKKATGRVAAIFAFLIAAAFAYILFAPTGFVEHLFPFLSNWQIDFLAPLNMSYDPSVVGFVDVFAETISLVIVDISQVTLMNWIVSGVIAVVALSLALYLIVAFVRIFTGKRSKKANLLYFLLFVVYALIAAFSIVSKFGWIEFVSWWWYVDLALPDPGWGWTVMAGFFFVVFIFSLIAKRKGEKKEKKVKQPKA